MWPYLIGVLLVILESTVINNIQILSVVPNLTLVYVVIISIYKEKEVSIPLVLFVGLIKDILCNGIFGLSMISYVIIAYLITRVNYKLYKENYLTIFIITVLSTLIDTVLSILATYLTYTSFSVDEILFKIGMIVLLNLISSYIFFRVYNEFEY